MPKRVRADAEPGTATGHVAGDEALDAAARQTPTAGVDEQCVAARQRDTVFQPRPQRACPYLIEGHDPFFAPLSHHPQYPSGKIAILEIEANKVPKPDPRRVE